MNSTEEITQGGITFNVEICIRIIHSEVCAFSPSNISELHRLELQDEIMRIRRQKYRICVLIIPRHPCPIGVAKRSLWKELLQLKGVQKHPSENTITV